MSDGLAETGGPSESIGALLQALQDRRHDVRAKAKEELDRLGDPETVEPLIALLQAPSWEVRSDVANVLGFLGDRRAVEPLLQVLRGLPAGRAYAASRWGNRKGADPGWIMGTADEVLLHQKGVCHVVAMALIALDDARAVEPLIEMLADPSRDVRGNAAWVLERLGDPRAIEPLWTLVEGDEAFARSQAISALGRLGDARVAERLLAMLDRSYDPIVANALGDLRERRAVEPLVAHLTATGERLRGG